MNSDNNFESLERLMELGMSMAVAQQMMQTMNHAIQNFTTTQFNNVNVPLPQTSHFFALVNEIPQGPFTEQELITHILAKRIDKETLIWLNGLPSWMQAQQLPEVAKFFELMPPSIK